jgi:hypothetical protein
MAVLSLLSLKRKKKRRRLLLMSGIIWILMHRSMTKRTRTIWQREWLSRRSELGAYETLLSELRVEDESSFLNFVRVSPNIFDDLLAKVQPIIERKTTNFRKPISAGMRLAITLRYLATGK